MAITLAEVFTLDRITRLAGRRGLAAASTIPDRDIEDLHERAGRLDATVRGTMPYTTAIWVEGTRKAAFSCTCPRGDDGRFCKHAGAVALTLHGGGSAAWRLDPIEAPDAAEDPALLDEVLALDHDVLARLVLDAASRDDRTAATLVARLTGEPATTSIDVKAWRKAVTAAFGPPSRFIDYRAAPEWAYGVGEVLDGLRGLVGEGHAAEVVGLVEHAFERADKAVLRVDSSDGCFWDISHDIAEIHLAACTEARPDPVALARRLVPLDLHAELDTFRRAAATYASVLGPDGLAEYRRLVEAEHVALGPADRTRYRTGDRLHVDEARVALAIAAGDVDELIAVKSEYLVAPSQYEEIIDELAGAGRTDEAVDWARRGLAIDGREHQKHGLRDRLVAVLREGGDIEGARTVRLEAFHMAPSLSAFDDLLDEYGPRRDPERARPEADALAWLRERAVTTGDPTVASTLVQILLHEGDLDGAWDVATTLGCDERWWPILARTREQDHPVDAIAIHQRTVAALIDRKQRKTYAAAADLLVRIRRLYGDADDSDAWTSYSTELLHTHRNKPSFMAIVREHGLA